MIGLEDFYNPDGFFRRAWTVGSKQIDNSVDDCVATQLMLVRTSQLDLGVNPASIESIDVIFFDHRRRLIDDLIKVYPIIIGCVSWFSDPEILDALKDRDGVSIVVNDVGLLPDGEGMTSAFPGYPVFEVAVGHGRRSLMHHKFLVGGVVEPGGSFTPKAVWTGSFNFTKSAEYHWENALLIKSGELGELYFAEFVRASNFGAALWPYLRAFDDDRPFVEEPEASPRAPVVQPERKSLKTSYDLARERELSAFYAGEAAFPSGLCAAALLAVERPQCPYSDVKLAKAWNAGWDRAAGEAARSLEPYWSDGELLRALHLGAQAVWSGRRRNPRCPFRRPDRAQAWKAGHDEARRLMSEDRPLQADPREKGSIAYYRALHAVKVAAGEDLRDPRSANAVIR